MSNTRVYPFLLAFFLLAVLSAPAQTPRVDSLKTVLGEQQDSSSRLRTLLALCNQKESLPGDTIYKYALRAHNIARGINDQSLLLLADYYVLLSIGNRGRLDTVLNEDQRVLRTLSYDKDRDLYTKYSLQLARICIKKANYKDAQQTAYTLLQKAEKSHDAIGVIYALTYIGWTYMEMEQLPAALEWFHKAEAELDASRPDLDYSPLYSNIAAVLDDLGKRDSAMIYVHRAIAISGKSQSLAYLANALAIQSDIFLHLGRTRDAETSLNRALDIRRQIGDPFYVLSDMAALASIYSRDNNTAEGIRLCREGIALARQYHFTPKELYLNEALAENYNAAGDYKNYSATLREIIALKDTLYRNNSNQALANLQANYESEKKENTIIEQKYILVRERYLTWGVTALLILFLIFGVIFFEIRRHRQALRDQQFETESLRKRQLAIDQTREEERKRILADLHDELGSGLSSIRIMSDLLAGHTQQPGLVARYAQKISDISRETAQGMNTIIWALNYENDTVQNLGEYIGNFGEALFEHSGICFHLILPADLPDLQLSGAHRKNLFLCVKESLHNVLKHSGARNAWVSITLKDGLLRLTVADDGRGLSPALDPVNGQPDPAANAVASIISHPFAPSKWGNGLKNIVRRMREIGGQVKVHPSPGLSIDLEVPLP